MMLTHTEMLTRIAAGAVLGGVIGYERDVHRRPVGLRTHLIVSMTAATFMIISSQFVFWQHYRKEDLVDVDPSRIAASIVSAVGFLAGGAILRNGISVQGLTTAAGLWLVTAIGMSCGSGMYVEGAAITVLGITALTLLRRFETKSLFRRRVTVVLGKDSDGPEAIGAALEKLGASLADVEYEGRYEESKERRTATFDVQFTEDVTVSKLVAAVESVRGVRRIRVRESA